MEILLLRVKKKKQSIISKSVAELEYTTIAMLYVKSSGLCLYCMSPVSNYPLFPYSDDTCGVALSENPIQHSNMKHVEIDLCLVREKGKKWVGLSEFCPCTSVVSCHFN